jgi:hypothetical protein
VGDERLATRVDVDLFTLLVQVGALATKRFSAGTLSEIFRFNVVPSVTVRVVMMHGLLGGMPW